MKAHRITNNEKCFINICQSNGIPAPEDITPDQLTEILSSETPSNYKIPMSITELRTILDKSGKDAVVCDVAIHPSFFRKIEAVIIFRDFLITIIFEALDTKYNMQINRDTWLILKNRKCMGELVKHRIQNRDVKTVFESYQNPSKEQKTLMNQSKGDTGTKQQKKLVTEIDSNIAKTIENSSLTTNRSIPLTSKSILKLNRAQYVEHADRNGIRKPEYRLFYDKRDDNQSQSLIAEIFLPEITTQKDFMLDLNNDRFVFEARRSGYSLDEFLPFEIDVIATKASFNDIQRVS